MEASGAAPPARVVEEADTPPKESDYLTIGNLQLVRAPGRAWPAPRCCARRLPPAGTCTSQPAQPPRPARPPHPLHTRRCCPTTLTSSATSRSA
jgi:hypothetical protein